jgi:hypothetical protein
MVRMGTKSRESIYGASIRAAAEQAAEARKTADRLACEAWNKRMLGFQGPAQPSPALGDALNAGYLYLEVKCLGCNTHQMVRSIAVACVNRLVPKRARSGGDYIEGLLRPKLKVSEDDLDRVHLD